MKIKIFWHQYLIGHWYSVVTDQLRILITSGLYERCEEISIGCIGTQKEKDYLVKYVIAPYSKLKIKYYSDIPQDYEFPTLELIEKDNSEYYGLYFHAKGVTKPDATDVNHWRAFLNETVINQFGWHYQNLLKGFDVSSVNHMKSPDHFSGNFWWFNRKFINKLPKISTLNHRSRYLAEQWICMGRGNLAYQKFKEPGDTVFTIKNERWTTE
jgi:hypothetical protein